MKREKELLEQINREQERAALYLLQYTDSLVPVQNIMIAQGILTGMLSDILLNQATKGRNKRNIEAFEKVNHLMDIVEGFSKIEDQNKLARLNITALLNRTVELENENAELKRQLEANQKAWEAA